MTGDERLSHDLLRGRCKSINGDVLIHNLDCIFFVLGYGGGPCFGGMVNRKQRATEAGYQLVK
jgi:hypothetical protein